MVILVFRAKAQQLRKESCVVGKKLDYENAQSSDIVQLEINAASFQENEFLKGLLGNPVCVLMFIVLDGGGGKN